MRFFSLPHFPARDVTAVHHRRDYYVAGFVFIATAICLTTDGFAPQWMQPVLAVFGWTFLLFFLRSECRFVRAQVAVAVAFALTGEYFASVYMGGYTYRFGNVPAYVPAGHGLVYLTAVLLARSALFQTHARRIAVFVVILAGLWAIWGIGFSPRQDVIGLVLYVVFLLYLFKGRSPMIYLAAFFITSWLELVGTTAGTWAWAVIDPASHLPQGNPPSGVAAWYCLVDAVAMAGAPHLLRLVEALNRCFAAKKLAFLDLADK